MTNRPDPLELLEQRLRDATSAALDETPAPTPVDEFASDFEQTTWHHH